MANSMKFVGLDVHAAQTHAAVLDRDTGELQFRKLRSAPTGVLEFLSGLEGDVRAVYESGPTGLDLAREMLGFDQCSVFAALRGGVRAWTDDR